jgi:hypothetical protein
MRYLLPLCMLLALAGSSTAQAQQSSLSTGIVQPVPVVPTPLISSLTSTACLTGCDTQAMNCQNSCIIVGANAVPGAIAQSTTVSCPLGCSTQQLVCKQVCARPQP